MPAAAKAFRAGPGLDGTGLGKGGADARAMGRAGRLRRRRADEETRRRHVRARERSHGVPRERRDLAAEASPRQPCRSSRWPPSSKVSSVSERREREQQRGTTGDDHDRRNESAIARHARRPGRRRATLRRPPSPGRLSSAAFVLDEDRPAEADHVATRAVRNASGSRWPVTPFARERPHVGHRGRLRTAPRRAREYAADRASTRAGRPCPAPLHGPRRRDSGHAHAATKRWDPSAEGRAPSSMEE